jgi:peroxiredoxin
LIQGAQRRNQIPGGQEMPKVEINTPAPDFELEDYQGKPTALEEFRGKNVVLVFNRGFL